MNESYGAKSLEDKMWLKIVEKNYGFSIYHASLISYKPTNVVQRCPSEHTKRTGIATHSERGKL